MRRGRHRMLNEQTIAHSPHERSGPGHHAQECREHQSVFHRGLPMLVRYKLLMPLEIAFHNSSSLGLKTVIAIIAITTSTPTKIAYSVVPWPRSSDSFAHIRMRALCNAHCPRTTASRALARILESVPFAET